MTSAQSTVLALQVSLGMYPSSGGSFGKAKLGLEAKLGLGLRVEGVKASGRIDLIFTLRCSLLDATGLPLERGMVVRKWSVAGANAEG